MGMFQRKKSFTFFLGEKSERTLFVLFGLLICGMNIKIPGTDARHLKERDETDSVIVEAIVESDRLPLPEPSSEESSSSSFRRSLLRKKSYENQNQHNQYEYYAENDNGDNGNYHHNRYSYFYDEPLRPSHVDTLLQQKSPALRSDLLTPKRQKVGAVYHISKAGNRKHNIFGGDDSDEENEFGLSHSSNFYNDGIESNEEDPHLHQERYKISFRNEETKAKNEDALHDDENSDEFGRYSLVNSYFDNEYSLTMLHKMECVTPTKSKGYCSTFRSCVPSLFTPDGQLEAPALAELISFSIGYCTMDDNAASGSSNILMKRNGHKFAEVSNRIICCPGTPPTSGSTPSAEESVEKFNDFLSGKGHEVSTIEEDDEKSSLGTVSMLGDAIVWNSQEKKSSASLIKIQTSMKNKNLDGMESSSELEKSKESEIINDDVKENSKEQIVNDDIKDFESHSIVLEASASPIAGFDNPNQSSSNEAIVIEPSFASSQERPTLSSQEQDQSLLIENPKNSKEKIDQDKLQTIPIEAFIPPHKIDSYDPHTNKFTDQLITSSDKGQSSGSVGIVQDSGKYSDGIGMHDAPGSFSDQDDRNFQSEYTTESIQNSENSRKNSSFIQIQPDPVIGVNGKFTLEKGVHVEKATSATPRPKPNPAHQTQIGETTVNIVKTEVAIDSNPILILNTNNQKDNNKFVSSKIPLENVESQSQINYNNVNEDSEDTMMDDENGIETTPFVSLGGNQYEELPTTTSSNIISSKESDFEANLKNNQAEDSKKGESNVISQAIIDVVGESNLGVEIDKESENLSTSNLKNGEENIANNSNNVGDELINIQQDSIVDEVNDFNNTIKPIAENIEHVHDSSTLIENFSDSPTTFIPSTTTKYFNDDTVENNHLNDNDSDSLILPTTTNKISSSEETTLGSYDVNPTTTGVKINDIEIIPDNNAQQTTISAGYYAQFGDDHTFRPTTVISVGLNEGLTESNNGGQFDDDNSEAEINKLVNNQMQMTAEHNQESNFNTKTQNTHSSVDDLSTFSPLKDRETLNPDITLSISTSPTLIPSEDSKTTILSEVTESFQPTTVTQSKVEEESPSVSQSDETFPGGSSIEQTQNKGESGSPGQIQLFLGKDPSNSYEFQSVDDSAEQSQHEGNKPNTIQDGTKTNNNNKNKPFLAGILGLKEPTGQNKFQGTASKVPPQVHEDDSLENEYNPSYLSTPNGWSIGQLYPEQDELNKPLNFDKTSDTPHSVENSHESNELNYGVNQPLFSGERYPEGSSQATKESSKESVESSGEQKYVPNSSGQVFSHVNHKEELSKEEQSSSSSHGATESVQPSLPVKELAQNKNPQVFINTNTKVSISSNEKTFDFQPTSITQVPPSVSTVVEISSTTQQIHKPTVAPTSSVVSEIASEIGGINFKPQDSAEILMIQPQYQILSACATQDYYRSLEQDSSKLYPFLATVVGGSRPFCSGSLITDRHILTAAHYLSNITVADVFHMRVHIGYKSGFGGQTEGPFQVRKVLKVIRHKGFSFDKLVNDIAILVLDRPVSFSEDVHPICLSNSPQLYSDGITEAFETGWVEDPLMKKISQHHPFVDPHILKYFSFGYENVTWTLQEAATKVRTNEECQSNYAFLEKSSGIVIRDSMICASHDINACSLKGNSGAPLYLSNEGKHIQIGIVSWGIGCGHFPAVFTQVSSYIPWIEKVVSRTS